METTQAEYRKKIIDGMRNPIPPREVKSGPCKDVVLIGEDAKFDGLPVCTHNAKDTGPFITLGLGFARHPKWGNNVSISRMQIFDNHTAGFRAMQQIGVYFVDLEKQGQPLEVAVTIGNDAYVTFCSQVSGPLDLDELGVAGGWMGAPVDVVRCETIDVMVPATSEIVLEGELFPGERRVEGPFAEFPGYYYGESEQPVFRLKAITHRHNPIYVTALTGRPMTENHVLRQIPVETMLYDRLRPVCPTIRDVCLTDGGAAMHAVISMRPTHRTQARDVMLAALTASRVKLVIVVDDDIDVRKPEEVEWAMASRFQADRDVVIIPRLRGMPPDPSTPETGVGAAMCIDATRPYGEKFAEVADAIGAEDFVIPGWTEAGRSSRG